MKNNLYKIFRKDGEFKRGDSVKDTFGRVIEIISTDGAKAVYFTHWRHGEPIAQSINLYELTLVEPKIPLIGVLEKLNWDNDGTINNKTITCGFWLDRLGKGNQLAFYDKDKLIFRWQLSDKSGEVPLHRQSKETRDSLWEILNE